MSNSQPWDESGRIVGRLSAETVEELRHVTNRYNSTFFHISLILACLADLSLNIFKPSEKNDYSTLLQLQGGMRRK